MPGWGCGAAGASPVTLLDDWCGEWQASTAGQKDKDRGRPLQQPGKPTAASAARLRAGHVATDRYNHRMTPEQCQRLLHAAGWTTGERSIATASGVRYVVDGANGENVVQAVAVTSTIAWL